MSKCLIYTPELNWIVVLSTLDLDYKNDNLVLKIILTWEKFIYKMNFSHVNYA